jgi:hypothetical protein
VCGESSPSQIEPDHERWHEIEIVVLAIPHQRDRPGKCLGRKKQEKQALREERRVPQRNGPSSGGRSWGHLGETARGRLATFGYQPITSRSPPLLNFAQIRLRKEGTVRRVEEYAVIYTLAVILELVGAAACAIMVITMWDAGAPGLRRWRR